MYSVLSITYSVSSEPTTGLVEIKYEKAFQQNMLDI